MIPFINKCVHCGQPIFNHDTAYPPNQLCSRCIGMLANALAEKRQFPQRGGYDALPSPRTILDEIHSCMSSIDAVVCNLSGETTELRSMRSTLEQLVTVIKGEK